MVALALEPDLVGPKGLASEVDGLAPLVHSAPSFSEIETAVSVLRAPSLDLDAAFVRLKALSSCTAAAMDDVAFAKVIAQPDDPAEEYSDGTQSCCLSTRLDGF